MKILCLLISIIFSLNAFSDVRLISVEGTAEKSFKPTLMSFNLTLWSKAQRAPEAQKIHEMEALKLKKTIASIGIAEKDVATISFDINPEFNYDQKTGRNNIIGYQVNETLQVTLRKIELIGKFIDSVVSNKEKSFGINVNNMQWDIDNRSEVQNALLVDAVKVAEAKAQLLAKAANVKIKNVYRLSPGPSNIGTPPVMNMKMMNASMESSERNNIQDGQVKINSIVNIDYEIE